MTPVTERTVKQQNYYAKKLGPFRHLVRMSDGGPHTTILEFTRSSDAARVAAALSIAYQQGIVAATDFCKDAIKEYIDVQRRQQRQTPATTAITESGAKSGGSGAQGNGSGS